MECKYCKEKHENENSGYQNSGYQNSGNQNSGNRNSGYWNSGDRNSGYWNSGNRNSGNQNSGYQNSGYWNSGYWNSGDRNSGDWNSGNQNSGYFNTTSPDRVRIFDTWLEMTDGEFNEKYNISADLPLNRWIDANNMSDIEKGDAKGWEQMGGYLKTLLFKEACQMWWSENPGRHQDFLSLPAFNAAKFLEITGINVSAVPLEPCIECGGTEKPILRQCLNCGGAIRACCPDHESKC